MNSNIFRWTREQVRGSGLRAQLVRGGIGSLVVKSGHAMLAFALAVMLARVLGPDGYGTYAFALAALMFIAIPAQVGVPQLVVRETAKAHASEDWGLMRGLWRWGNCAVIVFSSFGVLAAAGILVLTGGASDGGRAATIAIGIFLIPLIALANVRAACLRGLNRVVMGQLPEGIFRPTLLILLVGVCLVIPGTQDSPSPEAIMGLHVFAAFVTFLLGGLMLRRATPESVKNGPRPRYEYRAWRKAVIPLAMITGLQLINNYVDLIMLGMFRSNDAVGIYRAASQVALLVIFGLEAVNQVLQPHFARLYQQNEMGRLQRVVTASARTILGLALVPVFILILFGSEFLGQVFGDAFRAGGMSLTFLALGQLFNAGMGSVAMLLNMTGHERDTVLGVAFAAALNVVLNLVLIPLYGMEGAAAASAITIVFWNFLLWFFVKKRLGLDSTAIGIDFFRAP